LLRQAKPSRPIAIQAWNRVLDLVFPPRCVGCGDFGSFLCEVCINDMARATPPRCSICWMPAKAEVCERCRWGAPSFAAARSAFVYESTARKAVLALKFRGVSALAGEMAAEMSRSLAEWNPPVDVIVPVPLGGQRGRLRGYNEAELLAKEIARAAGLPMVTKTLVRPRATAAQTRQRDEEARRENVAGAFGLGPKPVSGGVLLVDDVLTTGATLDACATVLLEGGATSVNALTFARED